jgi:hypothetical protein
MGEKKKGWMIVVVSDLIQLLAACIQYLRGAKHPPLLNHDPHVRSKSLPYPPPNSFKKFPTQ